MVVVRCPFCSHRIGKPAPVPGTMGVYYCRSCRLDFGFYVPPIAIMRVYVALDDAATGGG